MTPAGGIKQFMYLAYLDDSGTRDRKKRFQLMSTIVIKDKQFHMLEVRSGAIAKSIVPDEKWEKFEEFHASELYGGFGVFNGIPQKERFDVIELLLKGIAQLQLPIFYGAVDKLEQTLYGSADPVDICFQTCIRGIEQWASKQDPVELVVLIVDDCNKDIKASLRKSFRRLREPLRTPIFPPGQAWHLHDDMYFGSSKESIGIQSADLCGYFIMKHLIGADPAAEGFYDIIKNLIV